MIKILVDGQELKAGQGWIWEAREAAITSECEVTKIAFSKDGPRGETEVRFVGAGWRGLSEREGALVADLRLIAEMELAELDWVEFVY